MNFVLNNLTIRNNSQNSGYNKLLFDLLIFLKDLIYINSTLGLKLTNVTFLDQEISFFENKHN